MASFALISWTESVETHSIWTSVTTMSLLALAILRQSLDFLRSKNSWSLLTSQNLGLPLGQIYEKVITALSQGHFAGAQGNLNCNQLNWYARVAKKNTQISCLGVLDAVCTKGDHIEDSVTLNIARRSNRCNLFAVLHV